jgi:enterochelin esterase-like enzyme
MKPSDRHAWPHVRRILWPLAALTAAALLTHAAGTPTRVGDHPVPPVPRTRAPREAPALVKLRRALADADPAARRQVVEQFVAATRATGTPLPARGGVSFLYQARPEEKEVQLVGELTGWNPRAGLSMIRIASTDLFTLTISLPRTARIEYQLRVDGRGILDPWARGSNDNGVGGRNSNFAMPGYRDRSLAAIDPEAPHGSVDELKLSDGRRCAVYRPPGYDGNGAARYPALYLHDGSDYQKRARVTEIADTLIARRRVRPLLIVMVDPIRRSEEYSLSDSYVRLTLEELVPRIDRDYRTDARPQARVIGGASMGGIVAAGLALEHPQVFGGALCQSGAYQVKDGHVLHLAAQHPRRDRRFWVDVGLYDLDFGGDANLLHAARRFRDALRSSGYPLRYVETPEGHNWTNWRARLPDALRWLFSR